MMGNSMRSCRKVGVAAIAVWSRARFRCKPGSWLFAAQPAPLAAFEATVDTLSSRKLRWRRARTLIDWAEAHLAPGEPGDRERAGELLREAEAEFEAMPAPLYVERVKARLKEP
jgi:hypothetical protein